MLCSVYLIDYKILPSHQITERIEYYKVITIPQSVGGTSSRKNNKKGYKYITASNYKFSTLKSKINDSSITIKVTPLFKTVKSVKTKKRQYNIQSGLNGISGIMTIGVFFTMLVSILYTLLKKKISENARLNLIYSNIFNYILWIYLSIKFVF